MDKYKLKQIIDHIISFDLTIEDKDINDKKSWQKMPHVNIVRLWSNNLNLWIDFYKSNEKENFFICYNNNSWVYLNNNNQFTKEWKERKLFFDWDGILNYGIENLNLDLDKKITDKSILFIQCNE